MIEESDHNPWSPQKCKPDEQEDHAAKRQKKSKITSLKLDIKPSHFNGTPEENVKHWVRDFKELMEAQNISPKDQRRLVPIFLQNTAKDWYYNQPEDTIVTIEQILPKLMQAFQATDAPMQLADAFFNRQQHTGESVTTYANALLTLARQMAETSDMIVRSRFISGLHSEIKFHVQKFNPSTFAEAMQLANNFEAAERSTNTVTIATFDLQLKNETGKPNEPVPTLPPEQPQQQSQLQELKKIIQELTSTIAEMKQYKSSKRREWQREEENNQENSNYRKRIKPRWNSNQGQYQRFFPSYSNRNKDRDARYSPRAHFYTLPPRSWQVNSNHNETMR